MQRIVNIWAGLALAVLIAVSTVGMIMWSHSFNSRAKPSELEASVAMKAHDSSIPDRYETMKNPLTNSGVNLVEAGGHYEEHCAACHGDNGNGEPKFQGLMYPRPSNLLPKTHRRCRTVRSISSSNKESVTPGCLPLASPATMMSTPGRWSRMFGIYHT